MSQLDRSHVTLQTANETYKLAYNIKAIRQISREFGGVRTAVDRVQRFDFDAMRYVIVEGASLDKGQAKALDKEIEATGLVELVEPVVRYLTLLFTGRHPDFDDTDGASEDEDGDVTGNAHAA